MFKKIILLLFLFLSFFGWVNLSFADKSDYTIDEWNIKVDTTLPWKLKENYLETIKDTRDNIASKTWESWIREIFPNIAKTIKNIFYVLAWLYFIVQVLILFFSSNTEEEVTKFKKSIIWISLWIMTMQIAYNFTDTLFDKDVDYTLAASFSENLIYPAIEILKFMASFIFLAMAIYAFFRLTTAHWDEEWVKKWKTTILQAIIWFFMVKVVDILVSYTYWRVNCVVTWNNIVDIWKRHWWVNPMNSCIDVPDPTWNIELILKTINWINWFVWIITLLFIIWAWSIILFSNGDSEKIKKAKWMIIWIIIWVFVLVMSYIILNFFIDPQSKWLIK